MEKGEYLVGTRKIEFDSIIDKAYEINKSFKDYAVDTAVEAPMFMDKNENFCFYSENRKNVKKSNITKYALAQACASWGIPSKYVLDLYSKEMGELVVKNIKELNKFNYNNNNRNNRSGLKTLVSDGVTEAVVSNKYAMNFPVCDVLDTVRQSADLSRYQPNQVYLSKSKMHIRFVDFDKKEKVGGEDMSVGFTIDSSDVGKSALKVQFFLYKFACMNGIVVVRNGGILYKQKHLGEAFSVSSIDDFKASFKNVELLRQNGLDLIASAQKRMMPENEMHHILDTCRKNYVSVSESERAKIIDLAANRYGRTKWGLINGITEVAQNHTLEDRLAYETWAGHLLYA